MISRQILAFALLVAFGAPLWAQEEEHPIDKALEAAIAKDPSTAGQIQAISAARGKWDKELNSHYQTLLKHLDEEAAKTLRESQRAWVNWRDKETKSLNAFYSKMQGTMYRPICSYAVMELTRGRVRKLALLAEVVELRETDKRDGDLTRATEELRTSPNTKWETHAHALQQE